MNRRLAAVLLLSALAGAGAWLAWGGRLGGGEGVSPSVGTEEGGAAKEAAPGEVPALAAGGSAAKGKANPAEAAAVQPASEDLRSKGSARAGRGGTVRGRVLRASDRTPVALALVTLRPFDAMLSALRVDPATRWDRLATRTDAEGRYEFRDVLPGTRYALTARGPRGPRVLLSSVEVLPGKAGGLEKDLLLPAEGATLSGHVRDAEGHAMSAVRVVVTAPGMLGSNAVVADPDRQPDRELETRTDADGAWIATDLEPGLKSVLFTAPSGARTALTKVLCKAGAPKTDVDVVLGAPLSIAGRVTFEGGAPMEGLRVVAKAISRPAVYDAVTGPEGTFRIDGLGSGPHGVGTVHPGLGLKVVGFFPAGSQDVRIELPRGGTIVGKVTRKVDGAPISDFSVRLYPQADEITSLSPVMDSVREALGPVRVHAADGAFRLTPVAAGEYTVGVEVEGAPSVWVDAVTVSADQELRLPPLEVPAARRLAGRVMDAAGAPVAGASLLWMKDDPSVEDDDLGAYRMEASEAVLSDADGRFEIAPVESGAYLVAATSRDRRPAVLHGVRVGDEDLVDLRLVIPPSAEILVRVLDSSGRRAADLAVCAASEGGLWRLDLTDASGEVHLPGLPPGAWTVAWQGAAVERALRDVHGDEKGARKAALDALPDARAITLSLGAASVVELRLPRLVHLRGRVRAPGGLAGTSQAWLSALDLGTHRLALDAEGRFELCNLEPGRYRLGLQRRIDGVEQSLQAEVSIPDVPEHEVDLELVERPR